jgi:ribosome-binding ATPase YchF (GTP1/OBG family)
MQLGIVGKPNVGKSTFFNAATKAHAEIANYPFTTIEANRGVMFIRKPCPCRELHVTCTPHNAQCIEGTRFVPIEALDVAGLVPDAHKGRGLGNKFLDDLRQAHALIHIVDASGSTDAEGNPTNVGAHDPIEDIKFLEKEIDYWLFGIIKKTWELNARKSELEDKKIEQMLADQLTGLGIKEDHITTAIRKLNLDRERPSLWHDNDLLKFTSFLRVLSKPMIIALNKSDLAPEPLMQKLLALPGYIMVPTSAESELALENALTKGVIEYVPGSKQYTILHPETLSDKQKNALGYIQTHVLDKYGSTGVHRCIDEAVRMLNLIVVYPVADEHKLTDKEGRVLPDAFLVPKGTTAKDLAFRVHTDLGNHFIRAIDARAHRVIGADHPVKDGDIISIIADI